MNWMAYICGKIEPLRLKAIHPSGRFGKSEPQGSVNSLMHQLSDSDWDKKKVAPKSY